MRLNSKGILGPFIFGKLVSHSRDERGLTVCKNSVPRQTGTWTLERGRKERRWRKLHDEDHNLYT